MPLIQQGGGKLGLGETPIGPTWDVQHYFLGADSQGRDVAARMLYGGRNSLLIGIGSARDLLRSSRRSSRSIAGFFGGASDSVLSRTDGRDLGVSGLSCSRSRVATVLLTAPNGLQVGPIHIDRVAASGCRR